MKLRRLCGSWFQAGILAASLLVAGSLAAQTGPHEMVDRMGRGINLGNTLSAPVEGNWSPPVTQKYFVDVKEAGFTNVRIPIRFETYTSTTAPYTVSSSYLNRIEQVIDWSLGQGLITVIDVHGDHWFWGSYDDGDPNTPTQATYDRFMSIWTHISDRFKDKSENLLFEIMNEPYFTMTANEVHAVNLDVLAIIRAKNPTRNVIITGGGLNSYEAPMQIKIELLGSDNYLIPTFHYYRPGNFTRSSREDKNDYDWGTPDDKSAVDSEFDQVLAWANTHNVPIFLGEFGADNEGGLNYNTGEPGSFGGPDKQSRINYHEYIAKAAVSRGFSFAVWCAGPKSNKSINLRTDNIVNSIKGVWVEEILDALIPKVVTGDLPDEAKNSAVVYPNPASLKVFLEGHNLTNLALHDLKGIKIDIQNYDEGSLDISKLPEGTYLLSGTNENKPFIEKILIKR